MHLMLQSVADFISSQEWAFATVDDHNLLLPMGTNQASWVIRVSLNAEDDVLTLLTRLPFNVPPARRKELALLLARINYGRRCGCFHMDVRDGEVLFCNSQLVDGVAVAPELLKPFFGLHFSAVNEHMAEITKAALGCAKPARQKEASSGAPPHHRRFNLN